MRLRTWQRVQPGGRCASSDHDVECAHGSWLPGLTVRDDLCCFLERDASSCHKNH